MAQEETKTENTAKATADKYHFDLYKRYPITLVSGKGVHVKDVDGNTYLDALAGIAVNGTGHCHPKVVKAIQEQAAELIHISNLYYNEPQSKLAKLLTEVSGMDRAFFCNSGAEAVEGSLKLARKYAHEQGKDGHIISMTGCFHGRTLGTIAMGKKKYQKGFDPMPGADGWQLSNVNVLSSAAHLASLEIFDEVGMSALIEKSKLLTGYLEFLLNSINKDAEKVNIITPSDPEERGCQLSLFILNNGKKVFEELSENGVVTDWREPNVIRVAPVPLYNTFSDIYHFYEILNNSLV